MIKNIALFTYTLLGGGAEKQLVLLANTYTKFHKVTIFIYYHDKIDKRIFNLLIINNNLSIVKLKGTFFKKFFFLNREIKKRNINYFFSYLTFPNLIGSINARLAGVQVIFSGIRTSYLPRNKWLIECMVNRYFADYTIFNNYLGEKRSHLFGLKKSRNIVISNCLDDIFEDSLPDKNNTKPVIISVGRFVEEKDYKTALQSIKILYDKGFEFEYVIIGYGELESEIRGLITSLSLQDIVKVIIRPTSVYKYLLRSDIYLSTSLFEGVSNSIIEAMNSNLPVVATNVGDNNYLIEDGYNGFLVDKKDVVDISRKLELLLNNIDKREEMGKNNKNVIDRKFSLQIFEAKYLGLLNINKSK